MRAPSLVAGVADMLHMLRAAGFRDDGEVPWEARRDVAAMLPMKEQVSVCLCFCFCPDLRPSTVAKILSRIDSKNGTAFRNLVTDHETTNERFPSEKSTQMRKLNAAVQIEF
jgi:hypothetical protein